jgi:hypothetical protein
MTEAATGPKAAEFFSNWLRGACWQALRSTALLFEMLEKPMLLMVNLSEMV